MQTQTAGTRSKDRLSEILRIHFDPVGGAPYWVEEARRKGINPRLQSMEELTCFGLMRPNDLASRPVTDFIPRSIASRPEDLIVAQTGGTLGQPVWTAYARDDFHAAFVQPFIDAAGHVGFPGGGSWLYVGPSGPHIIGLAARAIARAGGAMEPFLVDFDSRWARKLAPGSFAAERYLRHVVDQAVGILENQPITHIFTTPPVLAAIGEAMSNPQREAIRGVHYGGMAIDPADLRRFQTESFPNAVHLSGYGNTLLGCCLELDVSAGRSLRYFPHGTRLQFGVLPGDANSAAAIRRTPGARGKCVYTRIDNSTLLINLVERDEAELIAPPPDAPPAFSGPGVLDPRTNACETPATNGIY